MCLRSFSSSDITSVLKFLSFIVSDAQCAQYDAVESNWQDTISALPIASVSGSTAPPPAGMRYGDFRSISQQIPSICSYPGAGANLNSSSSSLRTPFLGERYDEVINVHSIIYVNIY